jgi:glycosyltransferase involved in cell wall biosynthesis
VDVLFISTSPFFTKERHCMKYLVYAESPYIQTGTGQLSHNIIPMLMESGHEIEIVAINHFENEHRGKEYPYKIHVCPDNEAFNLQKARELIAQGDYDALFLSSDVGQLNALADPIQEIKHQKNIPVIMYSTVDCDYINHQTLACLTLADYPVVYSQHSKRIAQRYLPALNIQVIEPGCEPELFYPLSEAERQEARQKVLGVGDDVFLVVNVNRNQWRKDPGRTLMIFHEFRKTHPNAVLYMHMKMQDIGGSLPDTAQMIGMQMRFPHAEVAFTKPSFNESSGIPREVLNLVYNAADVLVSTSTGEGWGLTMTEAMAAGRPLVMPRNTSFVEIIGENEERGYLADSGGDIDHLAIPYGLSDNPRALVHSKSMLEKLERVYALSKQHLPEAREELAEKTKSARQWALDHTWEHAREQWIELFKKVEATNGKLSQAVSA